MRKQLRIIKCSDPQLWYANLVGKCVPLMGIDEDGYWSEEPGGYKKIIRLDDAEILDEDDPCS